MLWFLFVGLIAGWLAGNLIRRSGFGVVGDVIIGVATGGAMALIYVVRLLKRAYFCPSCIGSGGPREQ
jgi:uncharacterized membrane protein YeaQ/YmgE (transglycosylase-associated protein family)